MDLSKVLLGATIAAASFASFAAHDYHKGDIVARLGVTGLHPGDSSEIRVNGVPTTNSKLVFRKDQVVGLNLAYFMTNTWNVQFDVHNDFRTEILAENLGVNDVGSARIFIPSLTANYYPSFNKVTVIKPYFGLGLSYARMNDERLSAAFNAFSAQSGVSKLSDRFGMVARAGFDLPVRNNLLLNASIGYDKTRSKWEVRGAPTHYMADLNLAAVQWFMGVGYKY